jgi:hypothetical protein
MIEGLFFFAGMAYLALWLLLLTWTGAIDVWLYRRRKRRSVNNPRS